MEVSVFDYVLTNVLSLLAGVFLGLGICACKKDTFLQRAKSLDNISQSSSSPQLVTALPTQLPTFHEITLK